MSASHLVFALTLTTYVILDVHFFEEPTYMKSTPELTVFNVRVRGYYNLCPSRG